MKQIPAALMIAGVVFSLSAESLTVTRKGADTVLESQFSDGYTLRQPLTVRKPNNQLNFLPPTLVGKHGAVMLSHSADDACPWNLNSTYIGGNHGDSIATGLEFKEPHGLTQADCGSEWVDPKGGKFYILKIENPKTVWVLSENLSKEKDVWRFARPAKVELKNAQSGKVLKNFDPKMRQLYSPVRITGQRFLADGKPVADHTSVQCKEFSVEEEYDIVATDAILKHVVRNKGKQVDFNAPGLDKVLSQKIVYTFYPNGSCIVTHRAKFFRDARLGYMGFIQAGQMTKGKYDRHLYYIPKVLPFEHAGEKWDFAGREDYTRQIKGSMMLERNTFENPASMPDRFVQYLSGNGQPDAGFVVGYSLTEGCTTPLERLKGTSNALFLYRSHKTYPFAINGAKIPSIRSGQEFYCMAYRQYFDPAKGFYMNKQGDNTIVYVDFHEPVKNKRIALSSELMKKKMTVIEKSESVSLTPQADGIVFHSAGRYGYAVLKFAK